MVKMQAAVEGGAIDSSINSPLGQKISLKLKNNHKNSKKAFSVAEAMIALLIGSVALGMAAPMITKQIKQNNFTDTQFRVLNRENDDILNRITELENRIQELENEDGSIPSGAVMFFNSAVKPESNTNPCPVGWTKIDDNWNGRFPRFAGSYTVLAYDTTNKTYKTTGTAQTLSVGAVQEDAIRNINGYGPALIYYHEDSYVKWQGLSGPFYKKYDSNNSTGGVRGAGNLGKPLNANILGFDSSKSVPIAVENRPKSVALLGCVKN